MVQMVEMIQPVRLVQLVKMVQSHEVVQLVVNGQTGKNGVIGLNNFKIKRSSCLKFPYKENGLTSQNGLTT